MLGSCFFAQPILKERRTLILTITNGAGGSLTEILDQHSGESASSPSLLETVQTNTHLLGQLLEKLDRLSEAVAPQNASRVEPGTDRERERSANTGSTHSSQLHQSFEIEQAKFEQQLAEFESQVVELKQQNRELAAKLADRDVRESIADNRELESLSWEERKQLILEQMERETFDAESFVSSLPYSPEGHETPELLVERMIGELESRRREVEELRALLDQQSQADDSQRAVGAAAIAKLVDSDDLVRQERERLKDLQSEWEEKMREAEITASLERAKLSRERQELAKQRAELDEELAHLRREFRDQEDTKDTTNRRWLVKLGLQ